MKNPILIAALLFLFCAKISAQVSGNYQQRANNDDNARANMMLGTDNKKVQLAVNLSDNPTILQAEVLYNAKPTSYLAIFAATQEGDNIAATDTFMNQRLDIFKRGLRAAGIADLQFYVDFISLVPKYEVVVEKKRRSKTANELPICFQLKKNIHVQFTDSRLMDKIISAAAVAEIYDLAKVEVNIPDLKRIHEELTAEGMKIIEAKAKRFAPLGIKAIPLSVGDNFETYYPTEQYEGYTAYSTDLSSLQYQQNVKQSKIAVKYAPKERTVFYNRLPYDQFDAVINPDFVEPPIQIHYKVVVKYATENSELAAKHKVDAQRETDRQEAVRKDEVDIRKIQVANPPKTCCDKN
jgi:hypothetical protein